MVINSQKTEKISVKQLKLFIAVAIKYYKSHTNHCPLGVYKKLSINLWANIATAKEPTLAQFL